MWISHFGNPSIVITGQGWQFESQLWKAFTCLLGMKHVYTMAYHPYANVLVESLHRQLKAALKVQPNPEQQTDTLPLFTGSPCCPKGEYRMFSCCIGGLV